MGDLSKIAIEGNWGLGESVVSGNVTPDKWMVDKVTYECVESRISEKTCEYILDGASGKVVAATIPPERANVRCLTDSEVTELTRVAKRIEQHYGTAQDIEWAIHREYALPESVFILQTRPETIWSKRQPDSRLGVSAATQKPDIRSAAENQGIGLDVKGKPNIVVAGILDTKGAEIKFIAERVRAAGGEPIVLELSLREESGEADVSLSDLLLLANRSPEELVSMVRTEAAEIIVGSAVTKITEMLSRNMIDGMIAFGGSTGTSMATRIMRVFPIGLPKLMLSTMASGDVSSYVGTRDIAMLYPIAEVGLNAITRRNPQLRRSGYRCHGFSSGPSR